MNNEKIFYRCNICGNLIGKINDSGVSIICCGEEMELLNDNTVDASKEKHVPVIEKDNNTIVVKIGSVPHPMEKDHYIEWVILKTSSITIRKKLNPGDEPTVIFPLLEDGKITVFAYCNKHSLWSNEIQ